MSTPDESAVGTVARPTRLPPRVQAFLVALLVLFYLVAGWRGREPTGIQGADELEYWALSRSLEDGSYREIFKANAPFQVKYPPAYPAWMMLVRYVAGENFDLIRVANLALVALALVVLFGVARRLAGAGLGLCLLLLLAMNRNLLMVGGSLMSEALFLFLSTAALAATLPADSSDRRRGVAVIAIALVAFLTRSAGITLVIAVGAWLWSRRRRGELAAWAAGSALIVGGWFAYTALAPSEGSGRSYAEELADASGAGASLAGFVVQLVQQLWHTAVTHVSAGLPDSLSLPTLPGTVVDNLVWLMLESVLIAVGFVVLWRGWRAAAVYLVLYAGLLMAWPSRDGRLLIPVIPLALLAFLLGAWSAADRLPDWARGPALGVLMALLALGAGGGALERDARGRRCDRVNPYVSPGCYNEDTRGLAAAAEYLREHSTLSDIVLTAKPSSVYFLSGRRTESSRLLLQVPAGSAAGTLRARHIRFVILTRLLPFETRDVAPALLGSCRELRVEASFLPTALLLSTPASGGGVGVPDACAALADFVRENSADPHSAAL